MIPEFEASQTRTEGMQVHVRILNRLDDAEHLAQKGIELQTEPAGSAPSPTAVRDAHDSFERLRVAQERRLMVKETMWPK